MTIRARPPNVRGEGDRLRPQLVQAAGELLSRPQPVMLPSLRAVARACSVSPAAVYLHFASSQALMEAVLDDQLDALSAAMRLAVPVDGSPRDRLHAFAAAYVGWGLDHPGAYQLLFETADRLLPPDLVRGGAGGSSPPEERSSQTVHHDRWDLITETSELVQQAAGTLEAEATRSAFRLWALLHGIVSLRLHKPDVRWPGELTADVHSTVDGVLLALAGST